MNMNINMIKIGYAALLFSASWVSNAGLITIGDLTLEQAGDSYVTDHVNNVDYLRWDQVKNLNFSELSTALQSGNAYDGWSIAGNIEANNFTNALLGSIGQCDSIVGNATCATDTTPYSYTDYVTLLGASFDSSPLNNYAFFLSDNGIGQEVGLVEYFSSGFDINTVLKLNEWSLIATSDQYSDNGTSPNGPIGFILYRDHTSTGTPVTDVPEPSSIAILTLGMIGLASRRFKKQSQ